MSGSNDDNFGKPWLLICEGVSDKNFFKKLFAVRGIGDSFAIKVPSEENQNGGGGRNAIGEYLRALAATEPVLNGDIKAILIVSDNDEDRAISFNEVQTEIEKAKWLPIPEAERAVSRTKDGLALVVLMLPFGELGNLESLCLISAYAKWGLQAELDTFVAVTPASNWPSGKQAKMRIQTMLAAHNKKQPDAGFASSWNQKLEYQIPVDHACFDQLASFIHDFQVFLDAKAQ